MGRRALVRIQQTPVHQPYPMRNGMGSVPRRVSAVNELEHGWSVLEAYGKQEAASRRRGRIERKHKEKDLWHERRLVKEQ